MTIKVTNITNKTDGDKFLASIDSPQLGDCEYGPCMEVTGWIFHSEQTIAEVRVINKYIDLRALNFPRPDLVAAYPHLAIRADNSGFHVHIWACDLADDPRLELIAVFEDGTSNIAAEIEVETSHPREISRSAPDVLLVSTLGRSGSSLLMGLLLKHPSLAGSRSPSYETHFIQAHVLRLKLAIMYLYPIVWSYRPFYDDDVRGMELYGLNRSDFKAVQPFLIKKYLDQFFELLESYASDCLKAPDNVAFICEKSTQTGQRGVARFLSWQCQGYREIVLVRDPRDLICSYLAFDMARGNFGQGFSRNFVENPESFFLQIGKLYDELISRIVHSGPKVHVVKYEALITEPRATMNKICTWLGVDANFFTEEHARGDDFLFEMGARHMTSRDQYDSIGRWKRDFPEKFFPYIDRYVRPQAQYFGYNWPQQVSDNAVKCSQDNNLLAGTC